MSSEQLIEKLKSKFGEAILGAAAKNGRVWVTVLKISGEWPTSFSAKWARGL